jgi:hypothetical protein
MFFMNTMTTGVEQETLVRAAFERVLPELLALPEDKLRPISLDVPGAVNTVLAVAENNLPELRPELVKLPGFDASHVDKLQDYALALSFANARHAAAEKESNALEPLADEASNLRERLLAEARFLTHHGVIDEAQLEQLKGATSKKNIATDVLTLASLLQDNWPKIQGKTPTTLQDLERASRVATRVGRILGANERGPTEMAEATEHRARAFTQLMNVYESVQRAVAYLRGDRYDAETIVPNLHQVAPARAVGPKKRRFRPALS